MKHSVMLFQRFGEVCSLSQLHVTNFRQIYLTLLVFLTVHICFYIGN